MSEMMKEVLLLSGGRTSALMLRRKLDECPDFRAQGLICFCNTGKEMPKTLDFVHAIETRWEVPVVWLEYARTQATETIANMFPTQRRIKNVMARAIAMEQTHWFNIVDYETASRNGEPFDELLKWMPQLPNVVSRVCSTQLKIRSVMRYLFSLGLKEYASIIGIRKDEEHRATQILASCDGFEHPQFPLVRDGITKTHVNEYWRKSDFDLGLKDYEGNCDNCFLKSKWKRIQMAREYPERLPWWENWETVKTNSGIKDGGQEFRRGEPYSLIRQLANGPQQAELFNDKDIPCSCLEKAYEREEYQQPTPARRDER